MEEENTIPEWVTYSPDPDSKKGKKIVLISGDEEYRSEEALPQLAQILASRHGFDCTVLFAQDPEHLGTIDPNYLHHIPGMEALEEADLMIIFTRFRALVDDQMQYIDQYLKAGKPVIGIRTATHAFEFKDTTSQWYHYSNSFKDESSPWNDGFGRLVLGEKWYSHHGHHKHQSTRGLVSPDAVGHPITKGIESGSIWGPTDVYGVRLPLPGDSQPIILGQVINRVDTFDQADPFFGMKPTDSEVATVNPVSKKAYNPNDPLMPFAWTKSYQLLEGTTGRAFASTIGAPTDMENEGVRRLFVNATYHLLDLEVPEKANVDLVGTYNPSAYSFKDDAYWDKKGLQVKDQME